MKKNQQKFQSRFEFIEGKVFEDLMQRQIPDEKTKKIKSKLNSYIKKRKSEGKSVGQFLLSTQRLFNRLYSPLQKGQKYPLLARRSDQTKRGRRFVYIGIDEKYYIGRVGKPLKVPMAKS